MVITTSHNTLIGQVHGRFYSKQRRLVRSAVKFSLQLPSPISPLYPVNDADVFTGVDLESRNLLYKCRGFWTYFEDEKWRHASWEKTYFIAFPAKHFVCHREPSTKDSEKWLSLYADWLRSILYCYLLTFGKLTMPDWLWSIFCYYLLTFGKLIRCQ